MPKKINPEAAKMTSGTPDSKTHLGIVADAESRPMTVPLVGLDFRFPGVVSLVHLLRFPFTAEPSLQQTRCIFYLGAAHGVRSLTRVTRGSLYSTRSERPSNPFWLAHGSRRCASTGSGDAPSAAPESSTQISPFSPVRSRRTMFRELYYP
jgi:hypothetical protein